MLQRFLESGRRALIVVAAPAEARAALRGLGIPAEESIQEWNRLDAGPLADLVLTGVGKANAAGAVARVLEPGRHALVINFGVAGALPMPGGPGSHLAFAAGIGSVHAASTCVFADEGVETPGAFLDVAAMGFPMAGLTGPGVPTDPTLTAALGVLGRVAPIATVSTCSGTDALARRTAERTSALVEGMEGAAVALAAHRFQVPMGEVRVVSNTTGDREKQEWALRPALEVLEGVIRRLFPNSR